MAALTLLEIAKTMQNTQQAAVVGTYASSYQPITAMPLKAAPQGVYQWYLENQLPYSTGGVRNLNGSWTRTAGSNSPKSETIRIYGGSFQIDRQLAKINPSAVEDQKKKQIEADARQLTIDMFEGAGGTSLYGIENVLDNDIDFANQTSLVGTSTTAAVLTTDALDILIGMIDKQPGNTFIYCTDAVGRMIRKLSRGSVTSSNSNYNVNYTPEQFGYFAGMYDDVPVVVLKDGAGNDMLTKTRATSSDGCSVYAVTYGDSAFTGFQVNPMEVIPLRDDTVYDFFDYEWPVGIAVQSKRCIARLRWVKNATS